MIEWLIAAAAVVSAIAAIWKLVVIPISKAVKRIHQTYDQVMDYGDRLDCVETRSLELIPNSGSSLRDAVDRIEHGQHANSRALAEHIAWGNSELVKLWQAIAAKDAVEAAALTAEVIADAQNDQERGI